MFMPSAKMITFIRHGELPDEHARTLIGNHPVPLSALGREQAAACGRFLSEETFDAAFHGTLNRVRETFDIASKIMKPFPAVQIDSRLNEVDFGDWDGRLYADLIREQPDRTAEWSMGNMQFGFPNGETMAGFRDRTQAVFRTILKTEGDRIVVFSHGGVIMSLLCDIIGLDRSNAFNVWLERGGIARVRVQCDNGTGQLCAMLHPYSLFRAKV